MHCHMGISLVCHGEVISISYVTSTGLVGLHVLVLTASDSMTVSHGMHTCGITLCSLLIHNEAEVDVKTIKIGIGR